MNLPSPTRPLIAGCLLAAALATPKVAQQGQLRVYVEEIALAAEDAGTITVIPSGAGGSPITITIPGSGMSGLVTVPLSVGEYAVAFEPPLCHRLLEGEPATVEVEITAGEITVLTFETEVFTDPPRLLTSRDEPPCVPVDAVALEPRSVNLVPSSSVEMEAELSDSDANSLSSRKVTWESADPDVVAIAIIDDTRVLLTGMAVGTTAITASSEGVSGTAAVTVSSTSAVQEVTWTEQASGTAEDLHDVWGVVSSDVFAVGSGGTILHYEGANWLAQTSTVSEDLYGVWGSAANDVFAVGAAGTVIYNDGGGWVPQASGTVRDLNAVWGTAPDNVFATGDGGVVLRFDGTSWNQLHSGGYEFHDVWGSAPRVFVVGPATTNSQESIVLRSQPPNWDWEQVSPHFTRTAHALWGPTADHLLVVGNGGLRVYTIDGGATWTTQGAGNFDLHDVIGFSDSDVIAVGGESPPIGTGSGLIAQYDGSSWALHFTGTAGVTATLNGVWGVASDDGFAVGDDGTILRLGPPVVSGTTDYLILHDNAPVTPLAAGSEMSSAIDTTVALIDAARAGCVDDEVVFTEEMTSTVALDVGNLQTLPACESRVAVFSVGDAMQLFEGVSWWTPAAGDAPEVSLEPDLLPVPVVIRVAEDAMKTKARADMMLAQLRYHDNRVGIEFDLQYDAVTNEIVVETLPSAATDLLGSSCAGAVPLRDAGIADSYTAGAINVYYVAAVQDPVSGTARAGFTCSQQARSDMVLVADDVLSDMADAVSGIMSLAHELGHALGLLQPADGHALMNEFPDDDANIMDIGTVGRKRFTLGQIYRMNVDEHAWLIETGLRTDAVECQCSPKPVASGVCPPVWKDFISHGSPRWGFLEPVCQVTITELDLDTAVTSLCLAPDEVYDVVAQTDTLADAGGTEMLHHYGANVRWWSTNPVVASAEMVQDLTTILPLPDPWWRSRITAGATAGAATLTVFAGGVSASIDVVVSGTCPPP